MDLPHRRSFDRDALTIAEPSDERVLAAVELNERRAQTVLDAKDSIGDGHALFRHLEQPDPRRLTVRRPFDPAEIGAALPGPPMLVARLAVERAGTGDRDVLAVDGVDERRQAHQLDALETRQHLRQILARVGAEQDRRAAFDVEIDVALEMNRAGKIAAGWHRHPPTSRRVASLYRGGKGRAAILDPITGRAVIMNVEVSRRKYRRHDARQDVRHRIPSRLR